MIYVVYYVSTNIEEQRRAVDLFLSGRPDSRVIREFVDDWEGAAHHCDLTHADLLLADVSAVPDSYSAIEFMARKPRNKKVRQQQLIFANIPDAITFAKQIMIAAEVHKRESASVLTPQRKVIEKVLAQPVRLVEVDVATEMIHFDKLPDGTWRMVVTKGLLA